MQKCIAFEPVCILRSYSRCVDAFVRIKDGEPRNCSNCLRAQKYLGGGIPKSCPKCKTQSPMLESGESLPEKLWPPFGQPNWRRGWRCMKCGTFFPLKPEELIKVV